MSERKPKNSDTEHEKPEPKSDLPRRTPAETEMLQNEIMSFKERIHGIVGIKLGRTYPNMVVEVTDLIMQKAVLSANTFKGDSSLYTWLYTIAINTIMDEEARFKRDMMMQAIRQESAYPPRRSSKPHEAPRDEISRIEHKIPARPKTTIEDRILNEQLKKQILAAIEQKNKKIIELFLLDMSREDIAALTGKTRNYVNVIIHRHMPLIREMYTKLTTLPKRQKKQSLGDETE